MILIASPMACAPAAQAETIERLGPWQLNSFARIVEAASGFRLKKWRNG